MTGIPLNTGNSLETNYNQVNGLMTDFRNDKAVRIIKDDTGTPVVILDKNGLRTTAPGSGIDVTDASDDQLTSNSNQNVFKIVKEGVRQVVVTTGASASVTFTVTIPHGFTFEPSYLVYVTPPPGTGGLLEQTPYFFHLYDAASTSFQVKAMARADIDATNLYCFVTTNNGSLYAGTWIFKYYLLQETAN